MLASCQKGRGSPHKILLKYVQRLWQSRELTERFISLADLYIVTTMPSQSPYTTIRVSRDTRKELSHIAGFYGLDSMDAAVSLLVEEARPEVEA